MYEMDVLSGVFLNYIKMRFMSTNKQDMVEYV